MERFGDVCMVYVDGHISAFRSKDSAPENAHGFVQKFLGELLERRVLSQIGVKLLEPTPMLTSFLRGAFG
ncbi:MAG: hypothetical protein C4331_03590 [Meiothermus sp.]